MSEASVLDRPSGSPDPLTLRNTDLNTLFDTLTLQAAKAVDVVVPAASIRVDAARLSVAEPVIDASGVTLLDGLFTPTRHAEAQIAAKLKIPLEYLRRLRTDAPGLWEANVGHWLGEAGEAGKSYLMRFLVDRERGGGVLRALLSQRYGIIDNLDVLLCALDGIRAAGVDVEIVSCDLSETKMYVTVVAPQIAVAAPGLLAGYRSPFDPSRTGETMPIINAGFRFSNSEVGSGKFTIVPWLRAQVCGNGLVQNLDAMSRIHVGAKLDDGTVDPSAATVDAVKALVTAQTTDAISHWLNPAYVEHKIRAMQAAAGVPVHDAPKTIEYVGKQLRMPESAQTELLNHFIKGGVLTSGGILHAVTSVAQTITDPDTAHDFGDSGIRAMELAAQFNTRQLATV
jgi:hypothetical protein